MESVRPNSCAILAQLKDFQRDTAEYVFRRMYTDADCVRRFLIADEVGLGKTVVARGLVAKVVDFLWDRRRRIDVIYVCSNADIARQNLNRLIVTGQDDFALASRITLLPINLDAMEKDRHKVNFISFTPGTSFEVGDSGGKSRERELLYWMLAEPWSLSEKKATCVLCAYAGIDGFRDRVQRFPRGQIHQGIAERFAEELGGRPEIRQEYDEISEGMPRAGVKPPPEVNRRRYRLIGELRTLLARTCLHWLEPDFIILDEFQRFKDLLQDGDENAPPAAQLAHHLFNFQEEQSDPTSAARVLLLSATPYKMYTLSEEAAQDDHYQDFCQTLDFLLPDPADRQAVRAELRRFREELLRWGHGSEAGLRAARSALEQRLRRVMVRTERLALSADRNGMLTTTHDDVPLAPADLRQYLAVQGIARAVGHGDVLEYWKSAPYLVNFMDEYDLKRRLKSALEGTTPETALVGALRRAERTMLSREDLESYCRLDPANARLRCLHRDLIGSEAWRLLWLPPSLPYYQGDGPYRDADGTKLTKRLVFSSWRVVPKAIAAVLSYEAERQMVQSYRRGARNTAEARKKRRALLQFRFSKGRAAGLPVLGLIYPCRTLAEEVDPLRFHGGAPSGTLPTLEEALDRVADGLEELLAPLLTRYGGREGPADESWYWAAPLLLDVQRHAEATLPWFARADLAAAWRGAAATEPDPAGGWERHVQLARDLVEGRTALGPPPDDLPRVLAQLALAGPGVVALRTLSRILPRPGSAATLNCKDCKEWSDRRQLQPGPDGPDLRDLAGSAAHAFLSLFNQPEVICLLRDRHNETPYWRSVLNYCCQGNLQAALDEYAHLLVESLGLIDKPAPCVACRVSLAIEQALTLRTATVQADLFAAQKRSVAREPLRLRTRFAMRFGDQEGEDGAQASRADHVRAAFNSPFWPFVLSTTSVGQEGLDFHMYCHAVVHWNLPSNPVDLEQREGRVHRFKGHALRKNIAAAHAAAACAGGDPWAAMFRAAREGYSDLGTFWIKPGPARIERHVLAVPHSREVGLYADLCRTLVAYRAVIGFYRQEDWVDGVAVRLPPDELERLLQLCRIDLAPPHACPTPAESSPAPIMAYSSAATGWDDCC